MLPLFIAPLVVPCLSPASAPTSTALAEARPATLHVSYADLSARPRDFLHVPVEIDVQFDAPLPRWNPYLSRFGAKDYAAVRAWSDDQLPWIEQEFENPAVQLFSRRDTPAERRLALADRHERFRLIVVVRELCAGRAWIEVVGVTRLARSIPEGTVIHAERALRLMSKGAFELALGELERALGPSLPAGARGELEQLQSICKEKQAAKAQADASR